MLATDNPEPSAPPKRPRSNKKLIAIGTLVTSAPFLIAIAIHVLLLLGGTALVVFEGGNPLAAFTSQTVEPGDGGSEFDAPPSPEEPAPEEQPAAAMAETLPEPVEAEQATDLLSVAVPTAIPSFAPPAAAKILGQAASGATTSTLPKVVQEKPRRFGNRARERSANAKSTLFGFQESVGGELTGTMYDLKLKADGKKPTGMDWKKFEEAMRKIVMNRMRTNVLSEYFAVPTKFYSTMVFIPCDKAYKAPEAFGVKNVVKPNFFFIHYRGPFAAPADGKYRFVGLGDESIIVLVDGTVRLEGNWNPGIAYTGKNYLQGASVLDFFPVIKKADENNARLREGDWVLMKEGETRTLDILLVEQGDVGSDTGGNFGFVLLVEKEGETYPEVKKGRNTRKKLPLFMLEPPDSAMAKVIKQYQDKLDVAYQEGPFFGTTEGGEAPLTDLPGPPPAPTGRGDSASDPVYEKGWTEGQTAGQAFSPWLLRQEDQGNKKSFSGFFLARQSEKPAILPLASGEKAWAMFANGEGFEQACASRPLEKPLEVGQTLLVDLISPQPSSEDGASGFTLRTGKSLGGPQDYNQGARFEWVALKTKPTYQIVDGQNQLESGLAVNSDGVRVELTLRSADTYDLKLTPLTGGKPTEFKDRKLGGAPGSPIESITLFNRNSETDFFFNNLRLNP